MTKGKMSQAYRPIGIAVGVLICLLPGTWSSVASEVPEVRGIYAFQDSTSMGITLEGFLRDGNARIVRMQADSNGNGDGYVSKEEVAHLAEGYSRLVNSSARQLGTPGGRILLNKTTFFSLSVESVQYNGAEGPVNGTNPIFQMQVLNAKYPLAPASMVEAKFETNFRTRGGSYGFNITSATINSPPKMTLDPSRGFPAGATLTSESRTVELTTGLHPGVAPFTLTFVAEPDADSIPGIDIVAILGVAAVMIFAKKGRGRAPIGSRWPTILCGIQKRG